MRVEFIVPGTAVPKGRPRGTRGGRFYTPKKTTDYEKVVRECWNKQSGYKFGDNAVSIDVCVYYKIPKSVSKKLRARMDGSPRVKRPDLDNIIKSVLDGLNGYAFNDDSSVWKINAMKIYSDEDKTVIVLEDDGEQLQKD